MNHAAQVFTRKSLVRALLAVAASLAPAISSAQAMLEEIVVTARKQSENVQDIAATVNVVSGDAVEKMVALRLEDVEQMTAGLSLTTVNARNSNISLRGISTDPETGSPPAVDAYWNDVNVRPDLAFTVLYDLERLEVLRGPQGTLQGRTSPAGAINIITRKPGLNETEGYVQGTAGDKGVLNGQFGISLPLIDDRLGVRVAGVHDESDALAIRNLTTGRESDASTDAVRLSAVWEPTGNFDATLVYEYQDRIIHEPKAVIGTDSLGVRPMLDYHDRRSLASTNDFAKLSSKVASLVMNWQLGDFDLTSVTGYIDSDKFSRQENDVANYVTQDFLSTYQNSATTAESKSQELRLSTSITDRWDLMLGAYYLDQETTTNFYAFAINAGINFTTTGYIPVNSEELSVFTFNEFALNDSTQLEIGLRYQNLERFRRADVNFGELTYLPPAFEPIRAIVEAGFRSRFPIEGVSPENVDSDDSAVTGSITLRHDLSDDIRVYASYNRGYRPGSVSIVPGASLPYIPSDALIYDEETSNAFEVGMKSRLLDGAATFNTALYYQVFDGYFARAVGLKVIDPARPDAPQDITGGITYNGDAVIWGLEMEGQILLAPNWSAGTSISYNKGEWDGAQKPCNDREPGEVLGYCDVDGESLGSEPNWSVSLNSEYSVPFENTAWYLRGLYKFTGERDNSSGAAGIGAVVDTFDSYQVFNLYTGLRSQDASWDVSLWVKNLFDEEVVLIQNGPDQFDVAASGGSYTQINVLALRSLGMTGRYSF